MTPPVPRQRLPREKAYQQPSSTALVLVVPACDTDSSSHMGQDARWNLNATGPQTLALHVILPVASTAHAAALLRRCREIPAFHLTVRSWKEKYGCFSPPLLYATTSD